MAPINNLSYGIVSWNILKELDPHTNISLFPIDFHPSLEQSTLVRKWIKRAEHFHANEPCLKIWHQHDMATRVGKGPFFGMPIFEVNGFNPQEVLHLESLDHVIVNSQWASSIVQKYCKVPVSVCPLGVDTSLFKPDTKLLEKKDFMFLNVGKMEKRKGHDILIEAFNKAFSKNMDVKLYLLWDNHFPNCNRQYWIDLAKKSRMGSQIYPLGRVDSPETVAMLMQQADCGVFPFRAEGWNLPLLEMMACNKPVIATNYSAPTEYLKEENAYLLDYTMEPAIDNEWKQFNGEFEWALPNIDQLVEWMRYVYRQRPTNLQGVLTAKQYTWTNSAMTILKTLQK